MCEASEVGVFIDLMLASTKIEQEHQPHPRDIGIKIAIDSGSGLNKRNAASPEVVCRSRQGLTAGITKNLPGVKSFQ